MLVSYQIACTEVRRAPRAELVKACFKYIISPEGQQAAAQNAGSAPLSDALRTKFQPAVDAIAAADQISRGRSSPEPALSSRASCPGDR